LDNDLADRLKQAAAADGVSFKQVVNEALRAGLGLRGRPPRRPRTPRLRTFRSPLRAGVDAAKLNQLVDQLEAESHLAKRLGERPRV
jgi:hypothetical protein